MSCTNTWGPSRITGTSWKSPVASRPGYPLGYEGQRSWPNREVTRVEDKNRNKITVAEAAEYLGLTRTTVQQMVERGVLKADRFAGAIHIPREEVERIERETAP
jgi:excisionase family DNA binding protein